MTAVALVAGLLLSSGCGGEESAQAREKITLLSVDAPLREPTYVNKKNFVLTLVQDKPWVVRLDENAPGVQVAARSEGLEGVGENMAPNSLKADEVYLPSRTSAGLC